MIMLQDIFEGIAADMMVTLFLLGNEYICVVVVVVVVRGRMIAAIDWPLVVDKTHLCLLTMRLKSLVERQRGSPKLVIEDSTSTST
jgi:hypothetical protein